MIRKIVMASAVALVPVAAVTTVGLSGVASAKGKTPPVAVTCAIGGTITFPTGGITQDGTYGSKTTTSTSALTSSTAGCSGSTVNLVAKSAKCKTVTDGNVSQGAFTLYPDAQLLPSLPGCNANPKTTEANSAWGFAGGTLVNGVSSSAASGIKTELKKGVPFTDNGQAITLLVGSASGILPSGACGSEVGFALSGTVKKFATTTWNANICLGGDTGTGTTNSFLGDLTTELLHESTTSAPAGSGTETQSGVAITSATVDTATSTLAIS